MCVVRVMDGCVCAGSRVVSHRHTASIRGACGTYRATGATGEHFARRSRTRLQWWLPIPSIRTTLSISISLPFQKYIFFPFTSLPKIRPLFSFHFPSKNRKSFFFHFPSSPPCPLNLFISPSNLHATLNLTHPFQSFRPLLHTLCTHISITIFLPLPSIFQTIFLPSLIMLHVSFRLLIFDSIFSLP